MFILKIDFPIRFSKSMMFSGSPNIYMFVVQNPGFKNMNDHLFWGIHHMLKFRSVSWPTEEGELRNITYKVCVYRIWVVAVRVGDLQQLVRLGIRLIEVYSPFFQTAKFSW